MADYPAALYTQVNVAGTTLLATDDHADRHNDIGGEIVAIETTLGTNSGTAVLKNFTAGRFAARTVGETHGTSTWIGGTIGTANIGTSFIRGGTIGTAIIGTSTIQGGTFNGGVIGTPTILGPINASGTVTPLTAGAALAPTVGTMTDTVGSLTAVNAQAGQVFYSAMGTSAGNRGIPAPLNPTNGQSLTYAFKASGSANGTLSWNAIFRFSQDIGTPALGTGTTWNYFAWRYTSIDTKWDFMGQSKNII